MFGTAEQNNWNSFSKEIKERAETISLDQILSANLRALLGTIERPDSSFIETVEQTLTCSIEAHFPDFNAERENTKLDE